MKRLIIAALLVASLSGCTNSDIAREQLRQESEDNYGIMRTVTAYRELPIGEWVERHNKLADLAKDVYRQVMRKEPDDGPYLISWTRVF